MDDLENKSDIEKTEDELTKLHLEFIALTQDIQSCRGPQSEVNELNLQGIKILTNLRKVVGSFKKFAIEEEDKSIQSKKLNEIKTIEEQIAASVATFRRANVSAMLDLHQANRIELLESDLDVSLRKRVNKDKENLVKTASSTTDQLFSISRNLSDITARSGDTLDLLVTSSSGVTNTREELESTSSFITESGKLLDRYGRRDLTDKVLIMLAFAFFLSCVVYVIHCRLF